MAPTMETPERPAAVDAKGKGLVAVVELIYQGRYGLGGERLRTLVDCAVERHTILRRSQKRSNDDPMDDRDGKRTRTDELPELDVEAGTKAAGTPAEGTIETANRISESTQKGEGALATGMSQSSSTSAP